MAGCTTIGFARPRQVVERPLPLQAGGSVHNARVESSDTWPAPYSVVLTYAPVITWVPPPSASWPASTQPGRDRSSQPVLPPFAFPSLPPAALAESHRLSDMGSAASPTNTSTPAHRGADGSASTGASANPTTGAPAPAEPIPGSGAATLWHVACIACVALGIGSLACKLLLPLLPIPAGLLLHLPTLPFWTSLGLAIGGVLAYRVPEYLDIAGPWLFLAFGVAGACWGLEYWLTHRRRVQDLAAIPPTPAGPMPPLAPIFPIPGGPFPFTPGGQ